MMIPDLIQRSKRIVIKIGSALVTDEAPGLLRQAWLDALAADVAALHKQGKEIVIVSSGAVALGRSALGIDKATRPHGIPLEQKQAAASVGQVVLSGAYLKALGAHGIMAGQILLTRDDTESRKSHLNARATFRTLLAGGVIPVVNENDTVATAEIRYGDNDRLAARVAQMIEADLLIQLSTTDGMYTADPCINPSAKHIPVIDSLSDEIIAMAGDALPGLSTGGMKSKIDAAKISVGSGIPMIIIKGVDNHALGAAIEGNARGSVFLAEKKDAPARKKWILAHVKPSGTLIIDDGAIKALLDGKSLLPAGVKEISGDFGRGEAVIVQNLSGAEVAIGLAAYSAAEAAQIIGLKTEEIEAVLGYPARSAMIHRDDMALKA